MLIFLKPGSTPNGKSRVVGVVQGLDYSVESLTIGDREVFKVSGYDSPPHPDLFENLPAVDRVLPLSRTPPLATRPAPPGGGIVRVGSRAFGDGEFAIIAGPCAVESEGQLVEVAESVAAAGADFLRGGAFKPRTSPYDFQGLEKEGLRLLARARETTGLPIVTEAVDAASLEQIESFGDVIQIGARNMQNFALLKRAGRSRLPVMLKRGMAASMDELLMSAEYLLSEGNENVVLCERGIRTFSTHSRYTLDLAIVPVLKAATALPVIVDPSHACGSRVGVAPLARAALAAGAGGVMVEVHPNPMAALSDGRQSLNPEEFKQLAGELRALAPMVARKPEAVN